MGKIYFRPGRLVLRRCAALLAAAALVLALCACNRAATTPGPAQEYDLAVHFVDVGQGDAALLLCGGQAMLVDAGTEKSAQKLVDYIKTLGVDKLDYVVATHPHADHIGGMEAVLQGFEVGVFLMPDAVHTTATFERMLDAVAQNGCNAEYVFEGKVFALGSAEIKVLSPLEGETQGNLNNCSAVLSVVIGGFGMLMMGDAEAEIEARLLQGEIGEYNVLKVGHHGSNTSSSADFIKAVSPDYAVICCGAGNEYGHPHSKTLESLISARVLRTDLNGTVTLLITGGEIDVQTEKVIRS